MEKYSYGYKRFSLSERIGKRCDHDRRVRFSSFQKLFKALIEPQQPSMHAGMFVFRSGGYCCQWIRSITDPQGRKPE